MHSPDEQVFVVPVQSELSVHAAHPEAVQLVPAPQAAAPLQVQVPDVHVFVDPVQSPLVQQLEAGMHTSTQKLYPSGQAHSVPLHVCPSVQELVVRQ